MAGFFEVRRQAVPAGAPLVEHASKGGRRPLPVGELDMPFCFQHYLPIQPADEILCGEGCQQPVNAAAGSSGFTGVAQGKSVRHLFKLGHGNQGECYGNRAANACRNLCKRHHLHTIRCRQNRYIAGTSLAAVAGI